MTTDEVDTNIERIRSLASAIIAECDEWLRDPVPPPPPAPTGILTSPAELAKLPRDTTAAKNVEVWASRVPRAEISHNTGSDVTCLARAVWFGNRETWSYSVKNVIDLLGSVARTYNALSLGRSLPPYIFAADLLDYRPPAFLEWLREIRDFKLTEGGGPQHSLVSASETRPNNWGQHCLCARIAIDLFVGDTEDLRRAADIFYGFLGDALRWSRWEWGDESWHDPLVLPLSPIQPVRSRRGANRISISGCIPDDMRRGGAFAWPPTSLTGISYSWECLQGLVLSAIMLDRERIRQVGQSDAWLVVSPWQAQDEAILRAVKFLYSIPNGMGAARGDDAQTLWIIKRFCGWLPDHPLVEGCPPAKNAIGYDWLYA